MLTTHPVPAESTPLGKTRPSRNSLDNSGRRNSGRSLLAQHNVAAANSNKMSRNSTFASMRKDSKGMLTGNGSVPKVPSNPTHALGARRCISDMSLSRGGPATNNHDVVAHQRNATILMGQRSNAAGVKNLVAALQSKSKSGTEIPLKECAMLAQIASDAYYRVVIGTAGGVEALAVAMKAFPMHNNIQESCCSALGRLCERNGNNTAVVEHNGGLQSIMTAMKNHSDSIAVQSEACEALRKMSTLIVTEARKSGKEFLNELQQLLTAAKEMYITPAARNSAEQLLTAIAAIQG